MATQAILLDSTAFSYLVLEHGLKTWEAGGYVYAGKREPTGEWQLYRTSSPNWESIGVTSAATANPAAGANPAVITVPAGRKWLFMGAAGAITTDANAANRYPQVAFTDGTGTVLASIATTAITASLAAVVFSFSPGSQAAAVIAAAGIDVIPVGQGIELGPGYTIAVTMRNIQAGDDITAIRYFYKEALV